jgi:gamma-glutamylcyclotransferase (GGCT)/AIG2-like uncharacterized protein YtfP
MNDESISDDLDRFAEVYGDLDLTVLDTHKWHPVFVYGTMCRQGRNEHRLRERNDAYARYVSVTCTAENAFSMRARKTEHGYMAPVVKLGGEASIWGELWEVRYNVLLELDMFEGHPTVYRRQMIYTSGNQKAWMYLYQGDMECLSSNGVFLSKRDEVAWWMGK